VSAQPVRVVVREPAVVAAPKVRRARPGDRVHVVLAGESLWSIASDVLGSRATVANVAREVNRLWDLNGARIGTGDRDLLPVGTRLVLK
jgi:Tfp pilus assembly protein FimV